MSRAILTSLDATTYVLDKARELWTPPPSCLGKSVQKKAWVSNRKEEGPSRIVWGLRLQNACGQVLKTRIQVLVTCHNHTLRLAGNENKSMISSPKRVVDRNGDERLEKKRLHLRDALSRA